MGERTVRIGTRTLRVYDEGNPAGPAILQHHGTPLAGGPLGAWVEDAEARGARLICYDRPGYGGSTPAPGRAVADAAEDAVAIMDALGVERFATWGISGGAPHALACAALRPDRVLAAASLAGIVPFDAAGVNFFRGMGTDNHVEFGLAMAGRDHIARFAETEAAELREATAAEIGEAISTLVSEPDRAVLVDGVIGEYWTGTMDSTFAQGAAGWIDDDLAFVKAFGFDPSAIAVPTLVVHGRQDRMVPPSHSEWLARTIPGAEAWISDEDGHLTLLAHRVPAVHEWLLRHF
jgi:pimeloyl-ACP methyl ester carboxylesterase